MTMLKQDTWRPNPATDTVADAVKKSISPADPYATSGELELLRHQVDRLSHVVGLLAGVLDDKGLLDRGDILSLTDRQYIIEGG